MESFSTTGMLIDPEANTPRAIQVPATSKTYLGQTISKHLTGHQKIPSDILDDLASRFIINLPHDERNDMIRLFFQIELAHWFYIDLFDSKEFQNLVQCGMREFAIHLFEHIPFLRPHLSSIDKILEDWKEYKRSVPTYGAIIMSEDQKHVLLVQSYWNTNSWAFPKGKVNEQEYPIHCAAREVYEETGYDISDLIVPTDYMEAVINYQYIRLYLVPNVPLQTVFKPRTRKEIKCCKWFPLELLPINKYDQISKISLDIRPNAFFLAMPFIKLIKEAFRKNHTISNFDKQHQSALNMQNYSILQTKLSTISSTVNLLTYNNNNNNMQVSNAIYAAAAKTTTATTTTNTISSSSSTITGLSCRKSTTSIKQKNVRRQLFYGNDGVQNTTNFSNGHLEKSSSNIASNTIYGGNLKENSIAAIIESINNNNDIKSNSFLNESVAIRPMSITTDLVQENRQHHQREEQQPEDIKTINKPSFSKCNKFNSWPNFTFSRSCITNVFS